LGNVESDKTSDWENPEVVAPQNVGYIHPIEEEAVLGR
jgi:hypothetical protein